MQGDPERDRNRPRATGPSLDATAALGMVTAGMPSGEARPQQVEMCAAVARALEGRRHLVVQAGTGTGKSLAYLVPAVLSAQRVVVVTATKALQDQLAGKDLPMVADALAPAGVGVSYAVLKGRNNYLCRQRVSEVAGGYQATLAEGAADTEGAAGEGGADGEGDDEGAGEGAGDGAGEGGGGRGERLGDQVLRLVRWADETVTGDRAELPFEPHPRAWAQVSVGSRECPGARECPSGSVCFAERARAAAGAADVVVVNAHLYGSHLASGGGVLPPHEVVVFDEAHALEDVMTSCLGVELTPGRLRALVTLARPLVAARRGRRGRAAAPQDGDGAAAADAVSDAADRLQQALGDRIGGRVLSRTADGADGADPDLAAALALAAHRVQALVAQVRAAAGAGAAGSDDGPRRNRALTAAGHLLEDLARIEARGDGDVAWVEGGPRAPVLRLAPVDVGPPLAAGLWEDVTAVLTSATIPLRLTDRLGIDPDRVDQLDVGSPFDYPNHALLYVAKHLPDRASPAAEAAIHDELEALITAAGGRTLALFTSRRATERAAAELRERLDVPVLVQDDLPKPRLLHEFARDEATCLFATIGLWQGVDISGPSLSLVTLDRLPFARPDEPLMQARRDLAGANAFRTVDLPRAATLLAQGAGRLIRSADDRGVVAVLDPRLATAGYRRVLLAALPPMRRTIDRRQVLDFLRRILPAEGERPGESTSG